MSKRFTETEKWRDAWFRKLTPTQKCLWQYFVDNCDQAGVIDIDWELASFQIGAKVAEKDLAEFSRQIVRLENGKLWIQAFVRYQYGRLSRDCKPHYPVYAALERHGIAEERLSYPLAKAIEGYSIGFQSLQDKEKDKDKETEKDTAGKFTLPTPEEVSAYGSEIGFRIDAQKFCDFYASKGWMIGKNKMKDWRACVRTWKSQDNSLPFRQPDAQRIPDNLKGLDLSKVGL